MKGHVFQCREESKTTLQFQRTCKELTRFVASNYEEHEDMVYVIEFKEEPVIPEPPSPKTFTVKDELTTQMIELEPSWKEKMIYSKKYDIFAARENTYRLNMGSLYSLIWGQCSKAMQTKLKSIKSYQTIHARKQCHLLLKHIRGVMFNFETKDYLVLGLKKAIVNYYGCMQKKKETCANYLARV